MNKEETINKSLEKVMSQYKFNHRGCLVEKIIGGYEWAGKKFTTLVEFDDYLTELGKNKKS